MAQEQVRQFIDQATQSIQSGQFEGALSLIDQALAMAPDDVDAHILRGICLSQTGQPAAATEAFNRAISLDPNSAKARYNLAVHQYALGQKMEALARAREAASLDPSHSGARQLIQTVETEIAGPGAKATPNHNDPLSVPPVTAVPPQSVPPPVHAAPTQANPYSAPQAPREPEQAPAPSMPSVPPVPQPSIPPVEPGMHQPHNPYLKPGYEGPSHSIPWVENMGKSWVSIAWALSAANLLGGILLLIMVINIMSHNLTDQAQMIEAINRQTGMLWAIRILGFGSVLGLLGWSVVDIIDQRGNVMWLIPSILCTCCGFGWLTTPIYILAGRNK